ncbi:MAG TPA: PAS domain S-box protein [Steroidobacteraceae bacterium]|nr:PAS domain S-box protein [Steroidobacteraceae bacterium]
MLPAELVRSVLESAPDAMIVIDDAGVVLFANRQVPALFGYERAEVIGQPIERLLPERFRRRHVTHRRNYAGAVRVRPMGNGLDLFALRKDGSEFPVEISLSPIEQDGRMMVAAAIRDVTDRMAVEHEIREARAAADRANLGKSRFLATASHDLRQPLQSLALLNGALRRTVENADAREMLEQQEEAVAAMSRLLNALLDISKLESGAIKPDITDFKVAQLLEELRREFAGLAANKGLELLVEPTTVHARSDPALVSQALKNLVSNAIKYTSHGWVQLRSSLSGSLVRIEVCDTGVGISSEHLPLIFDEFYQVGVAANTSRNGYGLGLSIVQHVVKLLDLRIDVRSQPGEGSTFALEIPASSSPGDDAVESSGIRRVRGGRTGESNHLLLVEDDPGVRNATRMFLRGEGYRVTVAATLEEALQRLQENPDIRLIISDYHLAPGTTGTDVIAAARARLGGDFRAILVTGDTSSAIAGLHRDEHLRVTSKPINADELLAMIQALLAG